MAIGKLYSLRGRMVLLKNQKTKEQWERGSTYTNVRSKINKPIVKSLIVSQKNLYKQYGDIIEALKKDINDSNLKVNKELLLLTFLNNLFRNKLLQRHASSKIFTITGIET